MLFAQEAPPIVWTPVVQYGALALAFAAMTTLAWLLRVWRSDQKENQAKTEGLVERSVIAFERHTTAIDKLTTAIDSQNGTQRDLADRLLSRPWLEGRDQ